MTPRQAAIRARKIGRYCDEIVKLDIEIAKLSLKRRKLWDDSEWFRRMIRSWWAKATAKQKDEFHKKLLTAPWPGLPEEFSP